MRLFAHNVNGYVGAVVLDGQNGPTLWVGVDRSKTVGTYRTHELLDLVRVLRPLAEAGNMNADRAAALTLAVAEALADVGRRV